MEPVAIDLRGRDDADGDALGDGDNGAEELLTACLGALLRVVQERERPHAVVAQAAVVEQDAGDDERPRERPPSGLVRARHEARAEPPVETEKPLPGAERHPAEDNA